jgi:protein-tyrosine phosphatase
MGIEVLYVCTGNTHRSPMAERLSVARCVAPAELIRFRSAGTSAYEELSMDAAAAMAVRQLGAETSGHLSRLLTGPMLEDATLVLTATGEQRDFAIRKRPGIAAKTFTLKEFVRLGADSAPAAGPDDVGRVVAEAAQQRGLHRPGGPHRDDIGDPHGAGPSETLRCAVQVALAVDGVLTMLGVHRPDGDSSAGD